MLTATAPATGMPTAAQLRAVRAVAHGASYRTGGEQLGIGAEAFRSRLYAASTALNVASKSANLVYVCCQLRLLELPRVIPAPPSVPLRAEDAMALRLIALGYGYDLASYHLGTNRSGVEQRLRRVYRVLGASNQPQAVYRGVITGHVPLDLRHPTIGGSR